MSTATASSDAATEPRETASGARSGVLDRPLFLIVLLAGVALRLVNLGQSYWGDEDATVRLMRQSFWHMLRYGIVGSESTPPLYYVIAAIWTRTFGTGELALRSLSALIGLATIVTAFAIGTELRSTRAGLILASFVSLSPLMIWYSQDARAYPFLIFLTSIGLLFFARALRTGTQRSIWLWALASAAALTTHYFAIFVIIPEAVALLVIRKTRPRALWPTGCVVLIWFALLPLLLKQASTTEHISWITFLGLITRLEITLQWFTTGSWNLTFPLLAAAALFIAVIVGHAIIVRKVRERELIVLGVGTSSILLPIAASFIGHDYVTYQNLVASWMPLAAVLAAVLTGWTKVGAVLAVVLCGFALAANVKVESNTALQRPDWRLAAHELSVLPSDTLDLVYPHFEVGALQVYDRDVSVISDPYLSPVANPRSIRTRRLAILAEDPWSSSSASTLSFPVPSAFHQTGRVTFSTFVLVTYSARHAVPVAVARLTSIRPSGYLLATTPWTPSVFRELGTPARRASG